MPTFNAAELDALRSGIYRLSVFFRLDTDPVVRLWLGFGDIQPGANVFDEDGETYRGLGELRALPAFNQLLNGVAERVDFTVSGVSGEILEIAQGDDAEQIQRKRVDVGYGFMDQRWAMLGGVHWAARYIADILVIEQNPAGPSEPIVRTVALSCGTRFTGRRRPSFAYFSDQDQQARFPGDRFCEYTPRYAHGYSKPWPTF